MPTKHRLRDSADFTAVLRSRRSGRAAGPRLVVTVAPPRGDISRVGMVVSKAVGNSVIRNRTKRVLRHEMADLLPGLPTELDVVIRATPAAGTAPAALLRDDLDRLLDAAVRRRRG
nr:ribonuclease P protein component [Flexivirga oryzae]